MKIELPVANTAKLKKHKTSRYMKLCFPMLKNSDTKTKKGITYYQMKAHKIQLIELLKSQEKGCLDLFWG